MPLNLPDHGAEHHPAAARDLLSQLASTLESCPPAPGHRLRNHPGLHLRLASDTPISRIAATHLGPAAHPVRAVLFDKAPGANWALGWHQDRTVAVVTRHPVPGYGPWSVKAGIQHVEPPFAVIEAMVTLRIHLDPVPDTNAPLLIAPGSHRLGRIAEPDIAATVARLGTTTCLADPGDVWAYATPILHASAVSTGHAHRRVLQVDYAATDLAPPLRWAGV